MSKKEPILLVTGASGKLGRLVVATLLETIPASRIRASARRPESLQELAGLGVDVRAADFERPATLDVAFAGADRYYSSPAAKWANANRSTVTP